MATSLTCIGIVWAALSLLSAIVACAGFYLPFWIKGTILDRTDTYFGSFRRCNYPKISDTGTILIVEECGRYTTFADIPSVSWQICTVVVGIGCGLALLVGFTASMSCCMVDVINKSTARGAGIIQLVSGNDLNYLNNVGEVLTQVGNATQVSRRLMTSPVPMSRMLETFRGCFFSPLKPFTGGLVNL